MIESFTLLATLFSFGQRLRHELVDFKMLSRSQGLNVVEGRIRIGHLKCKSVTFSK